MATKTPSQTPPHIKITKNVVRIKHNDEIEIPVSRVWATQYIEYMLATNQEIVVEVAP